MSDQDSIFEEDKSTQTPSADAGTETVKPQEPSDQKDQFADLLGSIMTEDGRQKFNDVGAALNSIPHAQEHISKVESDNAALKAELEKRKTAEEILEAINKQSVSGSETPSSPGVDEAALAALVDKRLNEKSLVESQTVNINSVTAEMTRKFGDKADEVFYNTAKSLGMSADTINQMAASSPKAVLKLMGVDAQQVPTPQKSSSSVNTDTLTPQTPRTDLKFKDGQSMKELTDVWKRA